MAPFDHMGFNETQLLNKLSFSLDQQKLFKQIDNIPELHGAAVLYVDKDFTMVELRPFTPICRITPVKVVLREPPNDLNQAQFAAHLKGGQADTRESRLVGEVSGAALSCSAAFLGWIVVLGSGAAIPLTGGASGAVTYLAVAASAASTIQCGNGLYRAWNEVKDTEKNDFLDSQEWYQHTTFALDLISLGGAIAAGAATLKAVKLLQANSGKTAEAILKGLTRAEKKRLTQDIVRLNHPGISNKLLKGLVRSGHFPKRYTGIQINHALRLQLKDAIGASMSFAGSALSGTVNSLAVGIHEELSE
ncbi:hypothetical protein [Thalassomonas actiniarum]|uniref:NAD synthetase n=1 Tax=Thalassomonas actiniarum TaxID=485447 RepID=A0AAE9YSV7_9GAMM|nr:hypothetical protein [Thalassomonas actiniarum]WDD99823.1 hypothetical protein SG35_003890 [Thalassomonas actiniarum]